MARDGFTGEVPRKLKPHLSGTANRAEEKAIRLSDCNEGQMKGQLRAGLHPARRGRYRGPHLISASFM